MPPLPMLPQPCQPPTSHIPRKSHLLLTQGSQLTQILVEQNQPPGNVLRLRTGQLRTNLYQREGELQGPKEDEDKSYKL